MAQRGGARPGAGRKKGLASVMAEKARDILVEELMKSWLPIVQKAIEQATKGDAAARTWLNDNGFGKAMQRLSLEDPDGVLKSIIIQKYAEDSNDKAAA
jgi:hypothetical protein